MKILMVENNARFARTVYDLFLSDHDVTIAPTLREATQQLQNTTFDAILVDFDLDDGKGDALIAAIRASTPHQPIVAMSSHDRGNRRLLDAGANAACPKTQFKNITAVLKQLTDP